MRADVGAALRKWKWDFLLQENLARLRSIAGADDAALLEDIDHAGGAGVAEAEAAREQGGAIAESAASQGKDSGCCALGKV
jgi:hypothetical protein